MSHELLRSHTNIVRLLGISWMPRKLKIGNGDIQIPTLLVELASVLKGKPLTFELLIETSAETSLDLQTKTKLLSDVASGLTALHALGVVHGDVKPSNILIFNDNSRLTAKISDFGFCITGDQELQAARGGTPLWNAPECSRNAPETLRAHRHKATRDYFSYGLLIW
jgi:serine/threonine protein kinase